MLNKVILTGNIGQPPRVSVDQKGREIATFSLATNTTWKDTRGEWQKHVDWHHIAVFREPTVRWIKDVLKKGDTVYIEGKLIYHRQVDKYNQVQLSPTIVVAGNEGKIEYLRSKKPTPNSYKDSEDQEPLLKDFEDTLPHFLKNREGN